MLHGYFLLFGHSTELAVAGALIHPEGSQSWS